MDGLARVVTVVWSRFVLLFFVSFGNIPFS